MFKLVEYLKKTQMKKSILTFALMTAFGAFMLTSYAASSVTTTSSEICEGEHKCNDKCKKDKDGKCAEAKAEGKDSAKASCCKKEKKKSCCAKKSESSSKEKEDKTDKAE